MRLEDAEGHEVAVVDRLLQRVAAGGFPVELVEQTVGVVVDLLARRGGKTDEEGVEVLEDAPVAVVDGAVGFVDDDQVVVEWGEACAAG